MKCFSRIVAVSLVAAMAFGTSSVVTATAISIQNQGFDDQVVANGANPTVNPPTGWSQGGDPSALIAANNPYGADAPDNYVYGFYGASGNGTPEGGNGANIVGINYGGVGQAYLFQTLVTPLQAGTYTLTAAVGALTNLTPMDDYVISIGTGQYSELAHYEGTGASLAAVAGTLTDESVTVHVAADNPSLGQPIAVLLCGINTVSHSLSVTCFDNVRLDYVPEPGALSAAGYRRGKLIGLRLA